MLSLLVNACVNTLKKRVYALIDREMTASNYLQALHYCDRLLENHPLDGTGVLYRGMCLNYLGRFGECAEFLKDKLVEKDGFEEIYRTCCVAMSRTDQIESLHDVAGAACMLWPNDVEFLLYRMRALTRLKCTDDVDTLLDIATSRLGDATEPWHYVVVAAAHELLGDVPMARKVVTIGMERLEDSTELARLANHLADPKGDE